MKLLPFLTLLFLSLNGFAQEMREWRSKDGSKSFYGKYTGIKNDQDVLLQGEEQQHVKIPVAKLSSEDLDYLFKAASLKALNGKKGNIKGLTYKQGEILGPLDSDDGYGFFLYVPKSLASDRPSPLFLYTGPTGGKLLNIRELVEGAEVTGWIVAVAIEPDYYNSVDVNRGICNSIVQTLLSTAPIDKERLYFGGFSAGASVSYYNAKKWRACGLIPMSTYIPPRLDAPSCDTVIISGGSDFNRYTSAYARKQIGKNAVHWFHGEGHKTAPPWMMHDAMAQLEARYLNGDPANHKQGMSRYLYSMINWIEAFKEEDPHRAYYWVRYLKNTFELNVLQRAKLNPLFEELGKNEQNRLYGEGLQELDALSLSYIGTKTRESPIHFNDPDLTAKCEPLMQKYSQTPVINAVLEALCKPTDEPACKQPHWEE